MSSEDEREINELINVLKKIDQKVLKIDAVERAVIYVGWSLWVSLLILFLILIDVFNLPLEIYSICAILTMILSLYIINIKLPHGLKTLTIIYRSLGMDKGDRRLNIIISLSFAASFSILAPLLGSLYGEIGSASALLLSLGIGNSTIYLSIWFRYRILNKMGLFLSLLFFLFTLLNIYVYSVRQEYLWFITSISIIVIYLALALQNMISAFR